MTIEERIISLLRSGNIEMITLGAKLLTTIKEFEEQVRIFDMATDSHFAPSITKDSIFVSERKITLAKDSILLRYQQHFNIVGLNWVMYIHTTYIYLIKRSWGSAKKIIL